MEKLFPDPPLKNQNWAHLWINSQNFYIQFVFIVCQDEGYQNILTLSCRPLAFTSYRAFLKNKKRSRTSLPASFSAWFLKKNISFAIVNYLTKFHCLVTFTSWDIGQYVYCHCLLTSLRRHKFWNWPYLLNHAVFSAWSKHQDKNLNILRTKRTFKMKEKYFSSFLMGFHWSK